MVAVSSVSSVAVVVTVGVSVRTGVRVSSGVTGRVMSNYLVDACNVSLAIVGTVALDSIKSLVIRSSFFCRCLTGVMSMSVRLSVVISVCAIAAKPIS